MYTVHIVNLINWGSVRPQPFKPSHLFVLETQEASTNMPSHKCRERRPPVLHGASNSLTTPALPVATSQPYTTQIKIPKSFSANHHISVCPDFHQLSPEEGKNWILNCCWRRGHDFRWCHWVLSFAHCPWLHSLNVLSSPWKPEQFRYSPTIFYRGFLLATLPYSCCWWSTKATHVVCTVSLISASEACICISFWVVIGLLVASFTSLLLAMSFSFWGRPALGRYHTLFLIIDLTEMSLYPSPQLCFSIVFWWSFWEFSLVFTV